MLESLIKKRIADGDSTVINDQCTARLSSIYEAARALGWALKVGGLNPGERVMLVLDNSVDYFIAELAVMFIGGVVVPANTRLTERELRELNGLAQPVRWIVHATYTERLHAACAQASLNHVIELPSGLSNPFSHINECFGRAPDTFPLHAVEERDIAAIFPTAGTSGKPKGALTSVGALVAFVDVLRDAIGLTEADTLLMPLPLFYTGGFKVSLSVLLTGATLVLPTQWKGYELIDLIHRYKVSILWAVPSVWALVLGAASDPELLQSLRLIYRGGSFTPQRVIEQIDRLLPGRAHVQGYGLTECNFVTVERDSTEYVKSCGFPILRSEVMIDGAVKPGERGEVLVRGPQQFSGYFGNEAMTHDVIKDGWVHTNDIGSIDHDGRLYVYGRAGDIIIRGGENISAAEIEQCIIEIDGVIEAAVIGVEDDIFGHEIKAVIVSDAALDGDAVREQCAKVLAPYKIPKYIDFRREPLPKNTAGKVVKRELR